MTTPLIHRTKFQTPYILCWPFRQTLYKSVFHIIISDFKIKLRNGSPLVPLVQSLLLDQFNWWLKWSFTLKLKDWIFPRRAEPDRRDHERHLLSKNYWRVVRRWQRALRPVERGINPPVANRPPLRMQEISSFPSNFMTCQSSHIMTSSNVRIHQMVTHSLRIGHF